MSLSGLVEFSFHGTQDENGNQTLHEGATGRSERGEFQILGC